MWNKVTYSVLQWQTKDLMGRGLHTLHGPHAMLHLPPGTADSL